MSQFSISAMKRIFKDQDQTKRVSEDSAEELRDILEEKGMDISQLAIEKAESEGLKTVRPEHIREALNEVTA